MVILLARFFPTGGMLLPLALSFQRNTFDIVIIHPNGTLCHLQGLRSERCLDCAPNAQRGGHLVIHQQHRYLGELCLLYDAAGTIPAQK